ncbi:hypothetical protein CISIN_1g0448791mg, partial [Citrus sinensis]
KLFYQLPTDGAKMLMRDSGCSLYYDQDLCSINFTTIRISPRKASSPEVPAYTEVDSYKIYLFEEPCYQMSTHHCWSSSKHIPQTENFEEFISVTTKSECALAK